MADARQVVAAVIDMLQTRMAATPRPRLRVTWVLVPGLGRTALGR